MFTTDTHLKKVVKNDFVQGSTIHQLQKSVKLTNKGVILAILTLHYGSKLTNEGSFFTLSLSRMTLLLVNFDPLLKLVYYIVDYLFLIYIYTNARFIVICKPRTLNDGGEDSVKHRNRKKHRF